MKDLAVTRTLSVVFFVACDCHPKGAVSASCSDSGVCDCRPNVIGVKCDSCLDQYSGLYTGNVFP